MPVRAAVTGRAIKFRNPPRRRAHANSQHPHSNKYISTFVLPLHRLVWDATHPLAQHIMVAEETAVVRNFCDFILCFEVVGELERVLQGITLAIDRGTLHMSCADKLLRRHSTGPAGRSVPENSTRVGTAHVRSNG
jgi:hypothetical protein